MQGEVMKVGSHRATDDFGVPHVNGSGKRDGRVHSERGGRSEQRADVARGLHRIENEKAERGNMSERVERALGHAGNRKHSLRGVGFGSAAKLTFIDLGKRTTLCSQ